MKWFTYGSLFMFAAVSLGAFGAHALKARLPADRLEVFETAVRYQIYHALALFVVGYLLDRSISSAVSWAGVAFITGIVLFSGSLYAYALTGIRTFGMITPLGGLSFLIGWGLIFAAGVLSRSAS